MERDGAAEGTSDCGISNLRAERQGWVVLSHIIEFLEWQLTGEL
jgi:hypothetical protein